MSEIRLSNPNLRLYDAMRPMLKGLLGFLYPTKVENVENVPQQGAFVLCANHVSNLDPFVLGLNIPGRHVRFMAKAELFKVFLVRRFVGMFGAFPVHRGQRDMSAIRESLRILQEGHPLGIFPQGTRSKDNSRLKMENGVAMIILRAKVNVVPAYIDGRFRLFRRNRVTFGKIIDMSDLWGKFDSESMNEATRRIEESVWNMQ